MASFTKIILYAESTRLTAGVWRAFFGSARLLSYRVFQNDAENSPQAQQDFAAFLSQHHKTPIYLIANHIEEDYRSDTLPHVLGRARQDMVTRKLGQLFRNVTYRAAHFAGREAERRRDDRYIFLALNNEEYIQGWIKQIELQEANLAGVYLLSMMSQFLLNKLQIKPPHVLLAERINSNLRQSYFLYGQLCISRLSPMPDMPQSQQPIFYHTEIEKTRLYLIAQRLIARDTRLSTLIVDRDGSHADVCKSINLEQNMDCSTVDFANFAQSLGLTPEQSRLPELLYMQLLAMGNVPVNLAPPRLIKPYRVTTMRRWIAMSSALVLLAGIFVAGLNAYRFYEINRETALIQAQTRVQQQHYLEVSKNFPATPIPSANLQVVAELHDKIIQSSGQPERMMQILSLALDNAPEIQINRIHWVVSNNTNFKDADLPAERKSIQQPSIKAAPLPLDANVLYEMAIVNGEIKNFRGDYRSANNQVRLWVETLKNNPAVLQVALLQQPVNTNSYTDLHGSTADIGQNQAADAQFKLLVILQQKHLPS
jgi:hypothetical protein